MLDFKKGKLSMENLTTLKTIKEFDGEHYADWEITKLLREGWVFVTVRTFRPAPDSDGEMKERLIYTLGNELVK